MLLIVSKREKDAEMLRRTLFTFGMLSVPLSYGTPTYPAGGRVRGVLCIDPSEEIPDSFHANHRRSYSKIPRLLLKRPFDTVHTPKEYDAVISADLPPTKLVSAILEALSLLAGKDAALAMVGPARDHLMETHPTYLGNPLPLTPTERAIYRYLILQHPKTVTAKELLRYCTKPGSTPLLCNIPSHIYKINQKADNIIGQHIIHCPDNLGYRLFFDLC